MSQKAKARLSVLGIVALVGLVAGLMVLNPFRTDDSEDIAFAVPTGPPVIHPEFTSISAPSTGSYVQVTTQPSAFTNSEDGYTQVKVVDLTSGAESSWKTYSDTNALKIKFSGCGYGDLLEVHAKNGLDIATAIIGTVPAPSDSAPPDFAETSVGTTFSSGTFTVSGPQGSVFDASFPAVASLELQDGWSSSSPITIPGSGGQNTGSWSINVTASAGQRAILTVQDDYGNRTLLEFIVGQTISNAAWNQSGQDTFHSASPHQVDSETAGTAGVIPAGDGGSAITALGQDLLHTVTVYRAQAPILDLPVAVNYRSGIAYSTGGASVYDGPVGKGFDWTLDARLENTGGKYYWHPGDGRRIGPFNFDRYDGSDRLFDAPPGVFLQLRQVSSPSELHLTDAANTRHAFDTSSGLLIRIEDHYAYGHSPLASDPELNQVRLIRDDDEKVVRAILGNDQIVRFGWFHHDRLASIHHNDRAAYLDYHDDGTLSKVTLANGAAYDFEYESGTALLETIEEDVPSGSDILVLAAEYRSGTDRGVSAYNTRDTASAPSSEYTVSPNTSSGTTTITDPEGDVMVYAYNLSAPNELTYIEVQADSSDRSTSNGYPSTIGDPYGWRIDYTIDSVSYLISNRKVLTAGTGGSPWASPTVTDWHRWTYDNTSQQADDDPRLRSRVDSHSLVDPSTTSDEFTESWTYFPTSPWPSSHTSFDGVVEDYTWNLAGQLEHREIENVTRPSAPSTYYSIESEWVYDDHGRIEKEWSPDRLDSGSSYADVLHEYSTTGLDYGYMVAQRELSAANGLAWGPWVEYEHDIYGNVAIVRSPNRSSTENISEYTYDEVDRVLSQLDPEVTLHSSNKLRAETRYVYNGVGGHRLSQIRQAYFDEDGVRGTLTVPGVDPEWLYVDYTRSTTTGRVEKIETDFEWDSSSSTLRRTKTEVAYDLEGRVSTEKRYHSTGTAAADHALTSYDYDAAGRVLRREADPDDSGGENPYEWWFRYDGLGRIVESFNPSNEKVLTASTREGARVLYDEFGRVEESTTGKVRLSPEYGSESNVEVFSTKPVYPANTYRAEEIEKYLGTAKVYETSHDFDEAGRVTATTTWYSGPVTAQEFSYAPIDLYASGSPHRVYVPWDSASGTPDWGDYRETVLDDFERIEEVRVQDDDGSTVRELYATKYTYDYDNSSGYPQTGWLIQLDKVEYDEDADATLRYVTKFVHDELGRVIDAEDWGTSTSSAQQHALTRFDGMGRVYEAFNADGPHTSFTTTGVKARTSYNFSGFAVDQQAGFDLTSSYRSSTEFMYDLLGRLTKTTRKDLTAWGGSDRVRQVAFDDLNRPTSITDPLLGQAMLYSYGHTGDGYPYSQRTDAEDNIARRVLNETGQVLRLSRESTPILSGASYIEYEYGPTCGCGGVGKPSIATTYDSNDAWMTRVTRGYSPLGQVLSEHTEVQDGSTAVSMTMEALFDAAGRRTQLTYPENPAFSASSILAFTHRADGLTRSIKITPGGGVLAGQSNLTLADLKYSGRRGVLQKTMELVSGGGGVFAEIANSRDVLGRLTSKSFDLTSYAGFGSVEFPDFTDAIDEYDLDGRPLIRAQPPRTRTQSTQLYSRFSYKGAGWVETQRWDQEFASGNYSGGHYQGYGLNGFGETVSMTDTVYGVSTCSPPDYSSTIDYGLSTTNGLLQSIPNVAGNGEYQGIDFDGCRAPEDGPLYVKKHWSDRTYGYNNNGQAVTADETIRDERPCDSACGGCTDETIELETQYVNEWDYEYDLWGNRVEATQVRARWIRANSCGPDDPMTFDDSNSRTDRWFYDAFGRPVMTELPVERGSRLASGACTSSIRLFHAFDGDLRIFSRDTGELVQTESIADYYRDTFREYFCNPETGETIKFRNYRSDIGHSGDSNWPSGTHIGETYGTELYGVFGELLMGNGNPEASTPSINEDVLRGPIQFSCLVGGTAVAENPEEQADDKDNSEDLKGGDDDDSRPVGPMMIPEPWIGGWEDRIVGWPEPDPASDARSAQSELLTTDFDPRDLVLYGQIMHPEFLGGGGGGGLSGARQIPRWWWPRSWWKRVGRTPPAQAQRVAKPCASKEALKRRIKKHGERVKPGRGGRVKKGDGEAKPEATKDGKPTPKAPSGGSHTIPEGRTKHIFGDKKGHLPDTPRNRKLLKDVADDPCTTLGTDKHGNTWSATTNPDGTQTWVQTRGGKVINGGVNQTPRNFNPETGLSSPTKPGG